MHEQQQQQRKTFKLLQRLHLLDTHDIDIRFCCDKMFESRARQSYLFCATELINLFRPFPIDLKKFARALYEIK